MFIDLVLQQIKSNSREQVKQELITAYDYTLQYCIEHANNSLIFFISVFSDILWLEEASIRDVFRRLSIVIPEPADNSSNTYTSNPDQYGSIQSLLPDYTVSSQRFKHDLFENDCISCYPLEKYIKPDIYQRFSANYCLPENSNTHARPILDIELINEAPLVRCYLTLANRPRIGKNDKDITQDSQGNIIFFNVQLMNFSDPLRALTWAEDYIKNVEEHKHNNNPIVRSFLIPLENYIATISTTVAVDADRAPGQVKSLASNLLSPIPFSLVSFMNHCNTTAEDGKVRSLETLSNYLLGHTIDLANKNQIAHQYGRTQTTAQARQHWLDQKEYMILARDMERQLTGFRKPY